MNILVNAFIYLSIISSILISIYSFKFSLIRVYKKSKTYLLILLFSRLFILLNVVLYILILPECFDNLNLGEYNLYNYFTNFIDTIKYFLGVVIIYWVLIIFLVSLLLSAILFVGLNLYYNNKIVKDANN